MKKLTLKQQLEMWMHRALIAEAKCATMRDPGWPSVRRAHLKREPTCQACGISEYLEVHHITPFHVDSTKELSDENLITLCEAPDRNCHFNIGHLKNWKSYNATVRADAAAELQRRLTLK